MPAADWTIAGDGAILLRRRAAGDAAFGDERAAQSLNALAAIAAARHAGVPVAVSLGGARARSSSVKRRMEVRGVVNGITVYDDFAHHPTAIATTLDGLRRKVGGARILAVLEPRSNTMKLGVMKDGAAGQPGRRRPRVLLRREPGLGCARQALAPLGDKVPCSTISTRWSRRSRPRRRAGDHVLVMSNGGFGGIHAKLLARMGGVG